MNKTQFVSLETYKTPVYLDAAATTPTDKRVAALVLKMMVEEYGNAGSRTHVYGATASNAVLRARRQVAATLDASEEEVFFTSGATESNNIAILGLAPYGERTGRRHIVTTAIEHKAVLEPVEHLRENGFEITLVKPDINGHIDAAEVVAALRPDTLLCSVMHANNETGALQPITDIASRLRGSEILFHVDAAQSFGKETEELRNSRIDLISVSGHKIMGPKGIGALVARRRDDRRPPLSPLMFGGGQERGLRPGTLATPLIAGFGLACELAEKERDARRQACERIRREAISAFAVMDGFTVHGGIEKGVVSNILSFAIPGIDSEAVMVAAKDIVAISNGSACTSARYEPSHVLEAMSLPEDIIAGTVRISWTHDADPIDWHLLAARLEDLRF
ncbi:cysteine desulfurase DndA [Agrobacterium larrymoorei]|uniref:Cysteine desulfurase n=1 Tax=Agrobacterium larrymoorei TaxID=160699 RepID=A0A4D7E0U6_9HYPH|nr:cysteine desulfurase DndA [Agrobacterium larrymoorei]QCJ00890.1 cysteine desulfurase DndA [Agrobacterium larrymoorei]QYA10226.1 cysteine desulfurase DndA [Agrobacterium larrymoorei]